MNIVDELAREVKRESKKNGHSHQSWIAGNQAVSRFFQSFPLQYVSEVLVLNIRKILINSVQANSPTRGSVALRILSPQ